MLVPHKTVQLLSVIFFVVFTMSQCQENESRRAVTEHQLMHDRGRTMQSLKRLIWLSSAMEGLHTAQTRSSLLNLPKALKLGQNADRLPSAAGSSQPAGVENQHKVAMEGLLRDFLNPYLTPLPEREP